MGEFDPNDKNSWYFGMITREESNAILQVERDNGVFLVRDSRSIHGDYVLCVKEETKISNYIINKIQTNGKIMYRIGDQEFPEISELLTFYKIHYLESTSLIRPAKRQEFVSKYSYSSKDPEDLSFDEGEVLVLLRKDEDDWWMMQNKRGSIGLVPVKYLSKVTEPTSRTQLPDEPTVQNVPLKQPRTLPARAVVIRRRVPSYDPLALTLEVGDIVVVTAMHKTGQWEGEVKGRHGTFPFTYVKFEDEIEEQLEDC